MERTVRNASATFHKTAWWPGVIVITMPPFGAALSLRRVLLAKGERCAPKQVALTDDHGSMVADLRSQDLEESLLHVWREHGIILFLDGPRLLNSELARIVQVDQCVMLIGQL